MSIRRHAIRQSHRGESKMPLLITPAERAALQLLASGKPGHEIADQLGTSERDLEFRLTALFAKMGATELRDAVAAAVRRGLVLAD